MPHPHHHFQHHPHLCSPRGRHMGDEGGPGRGPRHHGDGPGHGPHGHGHGPDAARHLAHKRERMFEAGGLKLLALHLIGQQPSHGYDVIRAVGELVGGDYQPSPGTMYPTLSVLVDMGHVTATEAAGGRKQYAITPEGQAALAEQDEALQQLLARLSDGRKHERHQRPAQLIRALENFRTALRLKLDGRPGHPADPLTEAQIKALAAALDQAALQIEQV